MPQSPPCGTLTPVPSHRLLYLATIRTVHRSALYPRQAAQSFHLVHLADLHTGDGFGRDGVDCGAVSDERLSFLNTPAYDLFAHVSAKLKDGVAVPQDFAITRLLCVQS